jgi:hypothetical protein
LEIVESYFDGGRSGLTLHKRPAMKRLLARVASEDCAFGTVLVYDISRWGRFQDPDASAYYEYHCRLQGVDVRYVQEQFQPTGTPLDALFKGMKRVMAAEYSRELAVKTVAGQSAAMNQGFHLGSLPCIGVSRVAIAKHTGETRTLGAMEHKAMNREHVKWVRGPDHEVALVQRLFHLYATTDASVVQLADLLAAEGHRARNGRPLSRWRIGTLLASEVFIGNFVWGREKQGRRRLESDQAFRRIEGSFEPVVSRELWEAVKRKRAKKSGVFRSKAELLADLARAVSINPALTASDLRLLDCANRSTYVKWFGSFEAALAQIGRRPHKRKLDEYQRVARTRTLALALCGAAVAVLNEQGVHCVELSGARGGQSVLVRNLVTVRVQLIWRRERYGLMQWSLRKIYRDSFDHILVVRLLDDDAVFDSLLMSRADYFKHPLWFDDSLPPDAVSMRTDAEIAKCFSSLAPAKRQPHVSSGPEVLLLPSAPE